MKTKYETKATKTKFDGVPVGKIIRNRWIDAVYKHLSTDGEEYSFVSSGNTIVVGIKSEDGILIFECKRGFTEYRFAKKNDK